MGIAFAITHGTFNGFRVKDRLIRLACFVTWQLLVEFFSNCGRTEGFPQTSIGIFISVRRYGIVHVFGLEVIVRIRGYSILTVTSACEAIVQFVSASGTRRVRIYGNRVFTIIRLCQLTVNAFTTLFLNLRTVRLPIKRLTRACFVSCVVLSKRNVSAPQDEDVINVRAVNNVYTYYPSVFGNTAAIINRPRAPVLIIPDGVRTQDHCQVVKEASADQSIPPTA